MKILIIQQKMIGDVLTSSILFEALSQKFPQAELHYLIQKHTFPVVENNPYIDKFIFFDSEQHSSLPGLLKMIKQIRKEKYQIIIDVYAKINTALITAFSGAEKRISYYKKYTSGAYTKTYERKTTSATPAGLAIENRMLLLQGISSDFPAELKPKIYLTQTEKASAQQELERAGISKEKSLFMISILGSSPQKTYPLNYMAEVLDFIVSETRAQLLFNYIPKQKKEAEALLQRCSPETKKSIFFDVFGKNLREFLALTSCCDALIGNEGGAINMAKALNIPTFSIFSPQIKKENWSIYEDGIQNIAVHLRDYRPQAFTAHSKKELLKKSVHFYEQLNPNLIFAELKDFLNKNSKK